MPSFSGEDTKLQIGKETTWGTAVAPTVELDMITEEFGEEQIVQQEPTLIGKATAGRSDIMGKKVPGGFSMLVKPDNIGLILACAFGTEAAQAGVGGTSTVYDHDFSLVTGSANVLPHFTAVVDKKTGVYGYISNKINTIAFEMASNDYLRATVTTLGRAEQSDALESLTLSSLRAFNFNDMTVEIDDTIVNEVTSLTITINNNLEDDLFVADGSAYMIEVDRQRREVTIEMEMLWNTDIETYRDTNYIGGTDVKLEVIFTGDTAGEGESYTLTFLAPNAFIETMKPVIGGPERMRVSATFRAAAIGTDEPFTATLRDLLDNTHS